MIRALFTFVLNLINILRATTRRALKLISRSKKGPRRFVTLKLPSGVNLRGKSRKIGPLTIGLPSRGSWWVFDEAIDRIAADPDIEGVYFKAEGGPASLAEANAVAGRLDKLRRAGKRVVSHMDGGLLHDYVAATASDAVMMTPPGRLYTFGTRMEMTFLGDAFEKAGIEAQFINLGRYKTAMHRFTRRAITRPQQIMMRQLLHGLTHHAAARIGRRRGLSVDKAMTLFDKAPMAARDARRLGFIDHMVYADEVKATLEADCERPVKFVAAERYMATHIKNLSWKPLRRASRPQVAVLELKGMILQGNEGGLTRQIQNTITPKPVVRALKRLASDPGVKAVVLRIDSPGGSALASDLIWRQIRKLADKKPVIASLGNVAGSGGYYIAVACHEIVAHPETITGSIGVIAGKLSGGALLDKLGVHIDAVSHSEDSNFMSLTSALSERELHNLRQDIRSFYRRFIQRVAVGRAMPRRKVHRLGRGRVYTGSRAKAVGLVDHLGDLDVAIDR